MKLKTALGLSILITLANLSRAQTPGPPVTEESIRGDMQMHVCKDGDRLEALKTLFKKRGAADEDLKLEKFDNVENLVVSKKGKTDETIIVGAHYDKVVEGCG